MKKVLVFIFLWSCMMTGNSLMAQRRQLNSITMDQLRLHMDFLASDELKGRNTGEPGLEIAARYLAVQARSIGLMPADSNGDYLQPFAMVEREYDQATSKITVRGGGKPAESFSEPFFAFPQVSEERLLAEGEVVFAGYGIHAPEQAYDDFADVDIAGKVVLIMNRGPLNEEGTEARFENEKWNTMQSFRHKASYIYNHKPKAVLVVMDPKSGVGSVGEMVPGIANYLGHSRGLKGESEGSGPNDDLPRMFLVHRKLADELMARSGRDLARLQREIDRSLEPASFETGCTVRIDLRMNITEIQLSNVFGYIPGRDHSLGEEMVMYVAHYDHVGTDGQGRVFNGADDNASGTVALIEIAEAFMAGRKKPERSIGFLWVSAEEVGLFGSRYFVENPLVALENTSAVINLDMVGRRKTESDRESDRRGLTIVGGDTVKVIGGLQSDALMAINTRTLREMGMEGNYRYNDPSHPERYFYRSDHIHFARKDIPVIFYSTGTHDDYHRVTDVPGKIDYEKYLKMVRLSFKLGYNVAGYKGPIGVDNPFSGW